MRIRRTSSSDSGVTIAITSRYVIYSQLGDGDILTVREDGKVSRPLPRKHEFMSNQTVSLCSINAHDEFQIRVEEGKDLVFDFNEAMLGKLDEKVIRIAMLNLAQSVALLRSQRGDVLAAAGAAKGRLSIDDARAMAMPATATPAKMSTK